jgi:hypothetical protein
LGGRLGERACEVQSPEGARAPTGSNPSGSEKGYGFHGGRKPLERRFEAEEVSKGSARAERFKGNVESIVMEEESFERGSPGAWGAERGFRGSGDGTHREGSQTLRVKLPRSRAKLFGRLERDEKKGFRI